MKCHDELFSDLLGPQGPLTYESLSEKYGAAKVVRIRVTDARGVNLTATLRARLADLFPAPTWQCSTSGETVRVMVAPVADFERFLKELKIGAVTEQDAAQRTATIALDRTKLVDAP